MANKGLGRGLSALIPNISTKNVDYNFENRIIELPLLKSCTKQKSTTL